MKLIWSGYRANVECLLLPVRAHNDVAVAQLVDEPVQGASTGRDLLLAQVGIRSATASLNASRLASIAVRSPSSSHPIRTAPSDTGSMSGLLL